MRVAQECWDCLKGLTERTLNQVNAPSELKEKAKSLVLKYLEENFPKKPIPFQLATRLQEIIKEVTQTVDPFSRVKEREMNLARLILSSIPFNPDDLPQLIELSALGNSLDFFKGEEEIRWEMTQGVIFAIDQRKEFISDLRKRDKVLFLADNAGEVFFDAPLVHKLEEIAEVVYVVKGGPIQNDITVKELKVSKIRFKQVITTGLASPGLELEHCSFEFLSQLNDSGVIIAKGMGYYEAFSELNLGKRVLFLLKAKCPPIARSLSVPLGSYVAKYTIL